MTCPSCKGTKKIQLLHSTVECTDRATESRYHDWVAEFLLAVRNHRTPTDDCVEPLFREIGETDAEFRVRIKARSFSALYGLTERHKSHNTMIQDQASGYVLDAILMTDHMLALENPSAPQSGPFQVSDRLRSLTKDPMTRSKYLSPVVRNTRSPVRYLTLYHL